MAKKQAALAKFRGSQNGRGYAQAFKVVRIVVQAVRHESAGRRFAGVRYSAIAEVLLHSRETREFPALLLQFGNSFSGLNPVNSCADFDY